MQGRERERVRDFKYKELSDEWTSAMVKVENVQKDSSENGEEWKKKPSQQRDGELLDEWGKKNKKKTQRTK